MVASRHWSVEIFIDELLDAATADIEQITHEHVHLRR